MPSFLVPGFGKWMFMILETLFRFLLVFLFPDLLFLFYVFIYFSFTHLWLEVTWEIWLVICSPRKHAHIILVTLTFLRCTFLTKMFFSLYFLCLSIFKKWLQTSWHSNLNTSWCILRKHFPKYLKSHVFIYSFKIWTYHFKF